jgi:FtsH-binding integral membrane protein
MAGKPNVALRVVGIIGISIVICVASLIFLLLAACGVLTLRGSDAALSVALVAGYAAILGGGFYGIFRLAKGMKGAPASLEGVEEAAPPLPQATPAEASKLLEPLRLAMAASIGLSFLGMIAFRFQTPGQGSLPLSQLPFFVLYQLPYVAVFWLTRAGPERKGVGLAMTFCAVSALYGVWSLGTLLLFYTRISGMQPSTLISLADIVATGAAAFFSLQLWRRGPESRNDVAILIAGVLGSIVYLAVVQTLHRFVLMRGLLG